MEGSNHVRMPGKPKVVVTAEGQVVPAIDANRHTLRRIDDQTGAIQVMIPAFLQLSGKVFHIRK
jgi:hypothetical protein